MTLAPTLTLAPAPALALACATKETRTMSGPAEVAWLVLAEESAAASRLVNAKSSTCLGRGSGLGLGSSC